MNFYQATRWSQANRSALTLALILTFAALAWLFYYQPAQAGYEQLYNYYDWGPYYHSRQSTVSSAGRVLPATTTVDELTADQPIVGWIEAYPNPDAPEATQYFIGVEGQGLVEIRPDHIPPELDIAQLVGQYTALGLVEDERILAPVPPPTDATLAQRAVATSGENQPPALPPAGQTKGFFHRLELFSERIYDGSYNLFNPAGAPERAYRRLTERTAEVRQLIINRDTTADRALQLVTTTTHTLFDRDLDEETTRRLEERLAGLQIIVEEDIAAMPEEAESSYAKLRQAVADGVDAAADKLDKPAVTAGVVQGLQALKTIGVLPRDQADQIYRLDSRQAVRDAFEDFAANGYITHADIKGALDETAAALYPTQIRTIIELDKLNSLSRFEAVRPDDPTLAKLESFSATFIPGVTAVPPDLLPYWVATVNLDRLQQTIRPDYIPPQAISALEQHRPNTFAKYKELEYRFKPSPDDLAALEQYKTQLRQQFKDDPAALDNIDAYLPPQLQRIVGFHERFGLKEPEGWQRPVGLTELPFTGPGGLRNIDAIDQYCAANDCHNYAPPSGYALKPPVNVTFQPDTSGRPSMFPGLTSFRPPVAMYDIMPRAQTSYVGHNGCTNPTDCLRAFRDIPPAERARNFFVFQAPPPGFDNRPKIGEQMFDPNNLSAERQKMFEEMRASGQVDANGKLLRPLEGPVDNQGRPMPGPGPMYRPDGSPDPNYRPPLSTGAYYALPPDQRSGPYYAGPNQSNPYNPGAMYRSDGTYEPNYRPGAYAPGPYYPAGAYSSGPYPSGSTQPGAYMPGPYQPGPYSSSSSPSGTYMPGPASSGGTGSYYGPMPSGGSGSGPYYPSYSQPSGNYQPPPTSSTNYYTPPANDAPGGAVYAPPSDGQPAPPPADDTNYVPPPPSGDSSGDSSGNYAPPPGDDGGGGGEAPPPPGGDGGGGGGGEAPPPGGDGGGGGGDAPPPPG